MPPPALLREYDEVVPGLAERIVGMTEKSITGHIDRDNRLADAEIEISKSGQSMAFVLTLIALIASIVFFAKGNALAGGLLIGLPVVLLVRSFLPGSGGQPMQQADPRQDPPPSSPA